MRLSYPRPLVFLNLGILLLLSAPLATPARAANEPLASKDGRIQIQVPEGYAEKTPPTRTIQIEAVSEAEAATIIVVSEKQKDFDTLQAYAELVRQRMSDKLKDPQADDGEKLQVSGNPAIRYEITGISGNGLRMAFLVTIIQTETRFNQVVGSCLRAQFSDRKREFSHIAGTLKEVPPKAPDQPRSKKTP